MISIGLNLILGMLLTCALILGVRLEKRLRGLRQSHTDFAKAVNELDGAAARTETSLRDLRVGTENAKTEIASRIDQARIACQRLEKLTADAERLANQPLPLAHPVAHPQVVLAQAAQRTAPVAQAHPGMSAFARPQPEMMRPAAPVQTRPAPAAAPVRSRARSLDDDLFSSSAPPPARPAVREDFVAEPAFVEPVHAQQQYVQAQYAEPQYAEPVFVEPRAIEPRAAEPRMAQPRMPEPRMPEPRISEAHWADPTVVPFKADNDPLVGAPKMDRAAREAFYREVLERESSGSDPFEADSQFAYERRAMLAAVMGGRR